MHKQYEENMRRHLEDQRAAAMAEHRFRRREANFNIAMSLYTSAELGPMYAALNPDPRAYGIAREAANRLQLAALKFLTDTAKNPDSPPTESRGCEARGSE